MSELEQTYLIDPERLIQPDLLMADPTHPLITGRCPQCQFEFPCDDPPIHWDCSRCGWIDDSI
jgi:hypothetical protein